MPSKVVCPFTDGSCELDCESTCHLSRARQRVVAYKPDGREGRRKRDMRAIRVYLEALISATPIGEARERLTEANMALMLAEVAPEFTVAA